MPMAPPSSLRTQKASHGASHSRAVIAARAKALGIDHTEMERQYLEKVSLRRMVEPEDVAEVIWQAARYNGRPKVHWPVGLKSLLLQQTSKYSPDWLNRFINFHIAARH